MNRKYWDGNKIEKLNKDEIFVFGSNPEGIHGAGGAKAAIVFGAKFGQGRGLMGQTYGLVTKNLHKGFIEPSTNIKYEKEGYKSLSQEQIESNIKELYETAKNHKDKQFLVTFQFTKDNYGNPQKSLNGYNCEEMLNFFMCEEPPLNIIFHNSYKPFIDKIKDNIITFTKVSLPYGWMSNMSSHPITHESIIYPNSEALFQSLRFLGHPEIQNQIISQKSPMASKMVAKKYKEVLERNGYVFMEEQDINNMRLCVKLKMEQHPKLAEELINTNNSLIIEDCSARPNASGLFWGAKFTKDGWIGKNTLGTILMEERNSLILKKQNKQEYTFFFNLNSPFSNFHPSKFEYKEIIFISNEQFMMYSKAKNFNDETTATKIISLNNEIIAQQFINGFISREAIIKDKSLSAEWQNLMMKVKKLGREVQNYDDEIWNHRRTKIVLFGAREKFNQNPDLKQILMDTKNTIMVEASPYDKIWGIGLSIKDAQKISPDNWPGENLLGKILDKLKSEFKNELNKKMKI